MNSKLEKALLEKVSELQPELTGPARDLIQYAKEQFGETEYEYYAIPVYWRGKRDGHSRPVTGLEKYLVSKEQYEEHAEDSRNDRFEAFMGRLPRNYTDYQRKVTKPGWREALYLAFKEEVL